MSLTTEGNVGTHDRVYIVKYVEKKSSEITSHNQYHKSGYKLHTPEDKNVQKYKPLEFLG